MNNKGFTIKCNKCGAETKIRDRKTNSWKGLICSNKIISFFINWGYEEGSIKCSKCGNETKL